MGFWIVASVAVLRAAWWVSMYDCLIQLNNRYRSALAQIDVKLKKRYKLIPNLVETVKGYMAHEKYTFAAVKAARNSAQTASLAVAAVPGNAEAIWQKATAESGLSDTLGRLFGLSEAYHDLKAKENVRQITEELRSTESRVSFARQAYIGAVMHYSTALEVFPNSHVDCDGTFVSARLLQSTESPESRNSVKVSFP